METKQHTSEGVIYSGGDEAPTYLDIQAAAGVTKHLGGFNATHKLHERTRVAEANEVLDVGCGIGVGPAYIAKKFGCKVVGIDISPKMLEWAQARAERESVTELVSLREADVRELPFESDRFDVILVESVLAFVEDKEAALWELIRVLKPGGAIGLNETYWTEQPPPDMVPEMLAVGPSIITLAEWKSTWNRLPLVEQEFLPQDLDFRGEARDRIDWIGWRSLLAAWGRVLRFLITKPGWRASIREQFGTPTELMEYLGYGLFVGRKPQV